MNIKTMKTIQKNISHVIEIHGFTGEIIINLLYENIIDNDDYEGVYYFVHDAELYHIIVIYIDDRMHISLNREIARHIVE